MGATSVTGSGGGASRKLTTNELSILAASAPQIYFTGIVTVEEGLTSPPTSSNTITFPYPLPGSPSNYVVCLTSLNAGTVYVAYQSEEDGNFTGFTCVAEADGEVMYLVASVGSRPNL